MERNETKINMQDLSVGYDKQSILSHVSCTVSSGEILTLIGPNGAGKTTLLKTISRHLAPQFGTIFLDGKAISDYTSKEFAKKLSLLMTLRTEPELMTCEDVVATGRYPYTGWHGKLSSLDQEKISDAMEQMHVEKIREVEFRKISDGQRQRVMLARAICQEPEVLILDEPTSFLDIRHKLELLTLIRRQVSSHRIAAILSLHELDLAQKVSDHVLCIKDGRIDRYGTPEEVFTDGYIHKLYGISCGSYNELFGSVELSKSNHKPKVFVICGGGSGLSAFRQLQRHGIPFAAGILSEEDVDYAIAKQLAQEVVFTKAFEPMGETQFLHALQCVDSCTHVICCLEKFGTLNQLNEKLLYQAKSDNKFTSLNTLL